MNTRAKIMGLAALPLAGLLATGGVALAQTAGTPAGTQVVQQAVTHRAGDPCPEHAAKTVTQQGDQLRVRDRDCGTCGDHQAQTAQTADRTMEHARDGSCILDADR
jgi:hypothetical protein